MWNHTIPNDGYAPRTIAGYIGGPDVGSCNLINSAWEAGIDGSVPGGWGVLPIYVGAQAPYSSCSGTQNPDYIQSGNPTQQGLNDGSNAVSEAEARGFNPGSVLVDDMENFYWTGSCPGLVCAYLNGWVAEVASAGYTTMVYGLQAAECEAQLVGNPNQNFPAYIWPAWYVHESVWNVSYNISIPNGDWIYDQRDMQYESSLSSGSPYFLSYDADCADAGANGGLTASVWDTGGYNDGSGGVGESYSATPDYDYFC